MFLSLFRNVLHQSARITAVMSLLAASALAAQAQVVFSPPKNISNSSGNTQAQQVAVDSSGNINVVWADNSSGNYAIFFSRSSDAGATFSTPVSISKHAQSTASSPQIAVDASGNVDVVWTESSPDGSANFVYFSHSANGSSFTNPQNISGDAGAATGPRMAVESGGGVNVVWVDTSLGNSEVFFSRSADGGTSFSTPVDISNDAGDSLAPEIAAGPSGDINVAWEDDTPGVKYDVFFSRSINQGATFSTPLAVTKSEPGSGVHSLSQIAAGGNGNIYILWVHGPGFSVRGVLGLSTDGGATFSTKDATAAAIVTSAAMAMDPSGEDIGVVAQTFNFDEPGTSVLTNYSADAGASFLNFAPEIFGGSSPQVVVDSIGRFNFTYAQTPIFGSGFQCLCFQQSPDGVEFSRTTITSFAPSSPAAMALDPGGNVSVVWLQSASSGSPANVFFSRATVPPFSFSLSPANVIEGGSGTGTVKLISPAPSGGEVISLSSSNPSVVSVPTSVNVPEGAGSATFTVTANTVQSSSSATITASFNGSTNTATLVVNPLFRLFVFGNLTGGNTASGEVSLSQPAPSGGLVVGLSSSDPSVASVPASVTVPAGSTFALFSVPTSPVATPTTVQITGTSEAFTHSTSFTVQPAALQRLTVSPSTATGGASSTGTVTLTGPAITGGAVVSLSSSDPSASVPASVTVPAGATSASFTITTNPGSATTNVTISASYNGVTLTSTLTVQPLILQHLAVPSTVGGGATDSGIVTMNVAPPASGAVVSLSSSNPSIASVPATVTLPGGSGQSALFNISTSPVSVNTNVTISASFNGVTLTGTLTVQPIMLTNVLVFDLQGGTSTSNFAVVLNGPAPSGGAVISLSSSNPSVASVPGTVAIPQGESYQGFTMTTSTVTVNTPVTITASYNGVTLSQTITIYQP